MFNLCTEACALAALSLLVSTAVAQASQADPAAPLLSSVHRTAILVTGKDGSGNDQVHVGLDLDDHGDIVDLVINPEHEGDHYTLAQLRSEADVRVKDRTGVLFIRTPGLDPKQGGPVYLRWTRNVVFGGSGEIKLDLQRDDAGDWRLWNGGRIVSTLLVKSGLMGIDEIAPLLGLLGSARPVGPALANVELDLRSSRDVLGSVVESWGPRGPASPGEEQPAE